MLKNYFKITLRTIRKHKLYSLINIVGLTMGISCCILIYLFIQDEYSFDKFHDEGEQIYRLEEISYRKSKANIKPTPFFDSRSPEGMYQQPWLPLPLGPEIKARFPEVESFTRLDEATLLVRNSEEPFEQEVFYTDSNFFTVFSFPLLQGNPETVLSEPNSIVLTPKSAQLYFGEESPMGKSLTVNIRNEDHEFVVTGIAKAAPSNSSIQFEVVMDITRTPYYEFNKDRWNNFNTPLFVKLTKGTNMAAFESKLNEIAIERYSEDWQEERNHYNLPAESPVMEFKLSPLTSIHMNAAVSWPGGSNPLYSYILGAIAILILLIACINYVTLALAKSSGRAKEVGIRKTSGALRNQIAIQFWGETQLLTFIAMIAGICLTELALPFFNTVAGKSLSVNYVQNLEFLGVLLGITFLAGLVAGSYPALVLSRFQPVKVLKGLSSTGFKPRMAKGLLVVQYCLSIFLIISSVIMFKQLDYVNSKELGFNEEQVLFVPTHTGWNETGTNLMKLYRTELSGYQGIKNISGMAPAFTTGTNSYGFEIGERDMRSYIYYVDEQLISTLGFELINGREFSEDFNENNSIIINEAFAREMEWDNPIGQLVPWNDQENPSTVIGVVKDFHFQSLESEIQPMLFHINPEQGGVAYIAIKLEEGMISVTLPKLEQVWAEVAPFTPFNFFFLDDAVSAQYKDHKKWLQIMGTSTFIAILIACLGLFGLAGLTAVNKTKEIGIRKVLGAGIDQIILLLNKDIIILISVALLIASPISWYIMEQWLSDFTYRISMSLDIFILSALFALLIAIITVSYHSVKAALANPVDSLKNE